MCTSYKQNLMKPALIRIFIGCLLTIIAVGPVAAADTISVETKSIEIVSGKSVVLKSDLPVRRVSVGDPEVADFILISPREIYVSGKSAGTTNLTMWQNGRIVAVFDVTVSYDVAGLKQQLNMLLPDEKELRMTSTNDSITISGKISSAAAMAQAAALARAYAPEGKIQNLVQVGGVHQVMLEVRVAEITRTLTRRLGINIFYNRNGDFGISTLGNLANLVPPINAEIITGPLGWTVSPAVNSFFRFSSGKSTWTGLIDALNEDGLIKVLAEPTLIALSGQTANFLAGGEFPVPVPQGLGTVAIEYKPFGVGLQFAPTVLSSKKINMRVSPEVSDLDFSTAVQFEGFVIPGLRTRRTTTTVELADGQSFAIAGLLRDNVRSVVSKYPLLGDLPILGPLFQSKQFQKEETELIIIVTPHLVKPLDMANQPLPTDYYTDPNDFEFFILGATEGRLSNSNGAAGTLDGEFGHSPPKN